LPSLIFVEPDEPIASIDYDSAREADSFI